MIQGILNFYLVTSVYNQFTPVELRYKLLLNKEVQTRRTSKFSVFHKHRLLSLTENTIESEINAAAATISH